MNKRGLFITVEGVEGAGKTTNIEFIRNWLISKEIELFCTREPGGTPLSEDLRSLLLASREEEVSDLAELLMIFAARAQHLNTAILPALEEGKWVLCDRFTDATYAYQGGGRGLPQDAIATLELLVQKGNQPDVTFFLDLDVEAGLQRASNRGALDRFEQESVAFFERVRCAYWKRIKEDKSRFRVIDASVSLPEVQNQIERELNALFDYPK